MTKFFSFIKRKAPGYAKPYLSFIYFRSKNLLLQ